MDVCFKGLILLVIVTPVELCLRGDAERSTETSSDPPGMLGVPEVDLEEPTGMVRGNWKSPPRSVSDMFASNVTKLGSASSSVSTAASSDLSSDSEHIDSGGGVDADIRTKRAGRVALARKRGVDPPVPVN